MKKIFLNIPFLLLMLISSGCTTYQGQGFHVSEFWGGAGGDLKDAIQARKWGDAHAIYNEEAEFFLDHVENYKKEVDLVALQVNLLQKKPLKKATKETRKIKWPVEVGLWQKTKTELNTIYQSRDQYSASKLLSQDQYQSKEYKKLLKSIEQVENNIANNAIGFFSSYKHSEPKSFFSVYPIALDEKTFMGENFTHIQKTVSGYNTEQLDQFLLNYPRETVLNQDIVIAVESLYFQKLAEENYPGAYPDVSQFLALLKQAKEKGLNTARIVDENVKIYNLIKSEKTELQAFGLSVKEELPYTIHNETPHGEMTHNYTIVMREQSSSVEIESNNEKRINSEFHARSNWNPNPAYTSAVEEKKEYEAKIQIQEGHRQRVSAIFDQTRSELNSKRRQYNSECYGSNAQIPYCKDQSYTLSINETNLDSQSRSKLSSIDNELDNYRRQLAFSNATISMEPKVLEEKIYENYQYLVTSKVASKHSILTFTIFDKRNLQKSFLEREYFDVKDFSIISGLHEKDKQYKEIRGKYDYDYMISQWGRKPGEFQLKTLLETLSKGEYNSNAITQTVLLEE